MWKIQHFSETNQTDHEDAHNALFCGVELKTRQ